MMDERGRHADVVQKPGGLEMLAVVRRFHQRLRQSLDAGELLHRRRLLRRRLEHVRVRIVARPAHGTEDSHLVQLAGAFEILLN